MPRSGGEIRSLRLVSALASRVPLRLIVLTRCDTEALRTTTGAASAWCASSLRTGVRKGVVALRYGWPVPVAALWSTAVERQIGASGGSGEIVVLDHLRSAAYLPTRAPFVLSLHNAEAALVASLPEPGGLLARLERHWDLGTTRRLESHATTRARLVVTVSRHDAQLIGREALVVPNGADLPDPPPDLPAEGGLLFIGSLTYRPNREAIGWWASEVYPLLGPDTPPLTVVGRGAAEALSDLSRHPGLRIVGEVPDVAPYLSAARIVVCPLLTGGGTRLKVLEALAWARPLISTGKGVEGIDLENGRHFLRADTAGEFAAGTDRLLSDSSLAHRLSQAGRAFAEQASWQRVSAPFVTAMLELLQRVDL